MDAHREVIGIFACRSWQERVDPAPDCECHESIHREMRMADSEIREMPELLQGSEGLDGALHRSQKITYDACENENCW